MRFPGGFAYVVVPVDDALDNFEMLNASTSTSFAAVRKNTGGTKYLFKVTDPVASVFSRYQWYSEAEIRVVLADAEWIQT